MADATVARRPAAPVMATGPAEYDPPYRWAALAALAVFGLYALTLAPTTHFWDTSEYIATAHILGIPHPPGNPLFVVLARAWEVLLAPTGLSVAVRVNLFSAAMSALAHGFWFLLAHRILSGFSEHRGFRLVGAGVAVLVSATAFTVWNHSNVNEKVYTVSLFTIALLSWLAFRWRDNLGRGKDDNLLLLMVFILALSVGNHLMAFLVAPALLVFVLLVSPRTLLNGRLYAGAVLVAVLGLSIHLFLPLRAALDPVINEADPSCGSLGGALQSILTFGGSGCEELSAALTRQQYDKPSIFQSPVDPSLPRDAGLMVAQLLNYFQYFDWQWARSVSGDISWLAAGRIPFTLLFLGLGLYGALVHYRRERVSFWYVAVLFLTLSAGLVFYLNFRYGYSWPDEAVPRDWREVRERDYFYIVGFSVWGVWAGIGIAALWQRLAARLAGELDQGRRLLRAAPILALAFIPLVANWGWASRAGDYTARDWAYNLLMSVEPYGVLFTNGDNDTFPLWYLQEVEGIRRDVTVIVMSYLNTPWYAKQIRGLTTPCPPGRSWAEDPTRIICQRPYEAEEGPAIYARLLEQGDGPGRQPPTRSILPLTDQEIDEIAASPPFISRESQVIPVGRIQGAIPAGSIILPSDVFLAFIVNSSVDDRPIYFATTTQAYEEIGLGAHLVRHGVAYKLHNGAMDEVGGSVVRLPDSPASVVTGPYIDLERTDTLLWDVFVHRNGFPDEWDHWVDAPTQGIPLYYGWAHYAAAQAHAVLGQEAEVARHMERAEVWTGMGRR